MKMNKLLILAFLILVITPPAICQSLTEKAQISVITCGPTQTELYSAFGHSAIRVYDSLQGIDIAYNYGVFDFNQPHFYLNFARGFLYYKLGLYPYPLFRDYYISYNRSVHEQVLNLTLMQKQKVFDYLVWNAQPENETYRYDYFYNNCATKVRDVFAEVLKDEVTFDGTYIKTDYTIRDLTDLYLTQQPWGDLGIDICLGLPMDKKANPYEYMFLPDYIESAFDHASISVDGNKAPLVAAKKMVFESQPEKSSFSVFQPAIVLGFVLVLVTFVTYYNWKKKRNSRWFDVLLFGITGLIGLLLLFLWVFTDHKAAANNFNLLWALPTHFVAIFFLFFKRRWLPLYFKGSLIVYVVLLISWAFLPQHININLLPLVLALTLRSSFHAFSKPVVSKS